jgi:hypothetical protein
VVIGLDGFLLDKFALNGKIHVTSERRKYAKWKAAYIHNCLKSGQTPVAGPLATGEDQEEEQGMDQEQGQFMTLIDKI